MRQISLVIDEIDQTIFQIEQDSFHQDEDDFLMSVNDMGMPSFMPPFGPLEDMGFERRRFGGDKKVNNANKPKNLDINSMQSDDLIADENKKQPNTNKNRKKKLQKKQKKIEN